MYRLIETIKIVDGIPQNLEWHNLRMSNSSKLLNGKELHLDLNDFDIDEIFKKGVVKCRITYTDFIEKYEYAKYEYKKVNSFKLIFKDEVDYSHKYADRRELINLFNLRETYDDIIIVKYGRITDSSFANLCFKKNGEIFTPLIPLLNGTKRQKLINEKMIIPIEIKPIDIDKYDKIHLINAMIDLNDSTVE